MLPCRVSPLATDPGPAQAEHAKPVHIVPAWCVADGLSVLQAMLALSDTGHLLRFVQRDNHVDPQVGPHPRAIHAPPASNSICFAWFRPSCWARRLSFTAEDVRLQAGWAALAAAGRYSELVALLRARGQHDAALELIQSLSQHPDSLPVPPAGAAAEADRWHMAVWLALRIRVQTEPWSHTAWAAGCDAHELALLTVAQGRQRTWPASRACGRL